MNQRHKTIAAALILFLSCASNAWCAALSIPAVKQWRPAAGSFSLLEAEVRYQRSAADDFQSVAELFAHELSGILGNEIKVQRGGEPGAGRVCFQLAPDLATEAYEIEIGDGVTVKASSRQGAFYATRTILQMVLGDANRELPLGTVVDEPAYPIRSVLLDVGRKFMPFEQLKDWIRMMGWLKLNELHLHLNDNSWGRYPGYRLESKKFPELPSKDGYYTFQQIRELQEFAALYGVSIVPEIDSPGHSLAFTKLRPDLAHPMLNHSGFGLSYLDIRNPETYVFMESLLDEVAPLFDSKYFHIGTDEYRLGMIRDKEERDNTGELFRKYINHFSEYLRDKHGKTVRIWSGYEHMPGTTEPDKSVVIDMWVTSDAMAKSRAGYSFINSSHFYTYIVPGMPYYGVNNRFIYEKWSPSVFNVKTEGGVLEPNAPGLLGGKLNVWSDGGPTGYTWNEIARLSFPSMMAMSEKMWGTQGSADYDEFIKRTVVVEALPDVKLLTRSAVADSDGVVWSHEEGDLHFIANTSLALQLPEDPHDIEYPWTASFTLTRQSDTPGTDDVLISSDLAAFYVDLMQTRTDKKTKEEIVERGIGCVRAVKAPGYDPLHSFAPRVIVFDYKVPLNEKVTLTFIGERKKTTLYVNGERIASKNVQMVCPLEQLGDKHRSSFQGILHRAKILNRGAYVSPWRYR